MKIILLQALLLAASFSATKATTLRGRGLGAAADSLNSDLGDMGVKSYTTFGHVLAALNSLQVALVQATSGDVVATNQEGALDLSHLVTQAQSIQAKLDAATGGSGRRRLSEEQAVAEYRVPLETFAAFVSDRLSTCVDVAEIMEAKLEGGDDSNVAEVGLVQSEGFRSMAESLKEVQAELEKDIILEGVERRRSLATLDEIKNDVVALAKLEDSDMDLMILSLTDMASRLDLAVSLELTFQELTTLEAVGLSAIIVAFADMRERIGQYNTAS